MSRIISALGVITLAIACTPSSAATGNRSTTMTTTTAARNEQTIRRLYGEYVNQARDELLPELLASDYVGPDGARGPAAFATVIAGLRRGVPDIRFDVEDVVAEGDRVAIRWKWSGTHTGVLNGFSPSHRRVVNEGIAIYQLREGKVTRAWLQTDRLGFLQQIGVVPATLGPRPAD